MSAVLVTQCPSRELQALACLVAVAGLNLLVVSTAEAQGRAPVPAAESQSTLRADERLFLLGELESLYASWPMDVDDPSGFALSAAAVRNEAIKYQQRVTDAKLDARLGELFSDYIATLDAYTDFLASIEKIEKDAVIRASVVIQLVGDLSKRPFFCDAP